MILPSRDMLPLRFGKLWLLAGWLGVFAAVAGSLSPSTEPMPLILNDKITHALIYLTLMLWFAGIYRRQRYLLIAAALFAMGMALELFQARIGRDLSGLDVLANLAGIVVGLALAWRVLGGWCAKLEEWLLART